MNQAVLNASKPRTKAAGRRRGPWRTPPATGPEAKRRAAAILEVLAGVRTPTQAAQSLSVSVPRYYLLEQQALTGLLRACEPRPRKRGPSPERELDGLRKEVERLRREGARQQALVRAAQRTIGLEAPASTAATGKKSRQRRPSVRALKAAARLRQEIEAAGTARETVAKNPATAV